MAFSVDYSVSSDWGTGFQGAVTITTGDQPLNGWTVGFEADFVIREVWNAEIVSHVGRHYVVRNVAWNATVPAGGKLGFGFVADQASDQTPDDFALNGAPIVEALPTLSVADVEIVEGDAGSQEAVFTVSLSGPAKGPVTVAYATEAGNATAGSDFTAAAGILTFATGETSKVVRVPVAGDTAVEVDETFGLVLSAPTGATLADDRGIATVPNDDVPPPPPTISIADASIVEGQAGVKQLSFLVTLSAASTSPVSVDFATRLGTAAAGSDYVHKAGTLTFAAGETSKTITIGIKGDTASEADERFGLVLSKPVGAELGDAEAVGTILNDDAAPIAASIGDAMTVEGDAGTRLLNFTVSLSRAATSAVTVSYVTRNGTASGGSDYSGANSTVTFAAGETSKTIGITIRADKAIEGDETFKVALTSATGAVLGDAEGLGTIVDDDLPPPTISVSDAATLEGNAGPKLLSFTVSLSHPAATPISVDYVTLAGTATGGSDYSGKSGTVTFAAGETSKVVTVTVKGDTLIEADETMRLVLRNPNGAAIADGEGIGTIQNDDVAPALSISDATVVEGNAGTANALFTVSLTKAATAPVTVAYGTIGGTAQAGTDFTATSGVLTFAAGETVKTISVAVKGDTADEPHETFEVKLADAVGATLADAAGTGTIQDDDVPAPGAAGFLATRGNQIVDADGQSVRITGVNWFGLETEAFAPHGLHARNWQDMMDQMLDLGFNTIRLPFSAQLFEPGSRPNGISFHLNPDLQGLNGLQIMDKIVDYAGDIGLRIILDSHRSAAGGGPNGNGLWVDSGYTEAKWIDNWEMLAERYAGDPTVIGADLANEPHNGDWGGGGAADWTAAAERAGNAIHAVNDDWLIIVEGVETYQNDWYWWGGQLAGVANDQVVLNTPNKLVYSAHDYANSIWPQSWFYESNFPNNLPTVFDEHWGYIYRQNIAPVLIGEFGTKLEDPKDVAWLGEILAYMGGDFDTNGTSDIGPEDEGISFTWWSWNPNSGDTGGILMDDWTTPIAEKVALLQPHLFDLL